MRVGNNAGDAASMRKGSYDTRTCAAPPLRESWNKCRHCHCAAAATALLVFAQIKPNFTKFLHRTPPRAMAREAEHRAGACNLLQQQIDL